jgi:hypothetical protein
MFKQLLEAIFIPFKNILIRLLSFIIALVLVWIAWQFFINQDIENIISF